MGSRDSHGSDDSLVGRRLFQSPGAGQGRGINNFSSPTYSPQTPQDYAPYADSPTGFRPRGLDQQFQQPTYMGPQQGFMEMFEAPPQFTQSQMNFMMSNMMAQFGGQPGCQPMFMPSSKRSGNFMNSESEGSTVKRARQNEDDDDASSPSKRRKGKEKVTVSTAKKWEEKHDDFLIPCLARLAKEGFKCAKSFKGKAFTIASKELEEEFKEPFTPDHVKNHLHTLKRMYREMQNAATLLSGAGYDFSSKMIVIDEECIERNRSNKDISPKLFEWVNKPLKHYEDLALITGDDDVTDEFEKSSSQQFRSAPGVESHVDNMSHLDLDDDGEEDHHPNPLSSQVPCIPRQRMEETVYPTLPARDTRKGKKKGGKRAHMDDSYLAFRKDFNENFKAITRVFDKYASIMEHWTVRMSNALFDHTKYNNDILFMIAEEWTQDEAQARRFIALPKWAQEKMIEKFMDLHSLG